MKNFHIFIFIAALFFTVTSLNAASEDVEDTNNDGQADKWVSVDGEGVTSLKKDQDFDGKPDYHLKFDKNGRKILEEMDFNRDGKMDDYYFYENGVLVERKIDTNHDGKIDIWVFIHEGVYIEKYERDTDFDGEVDVVKDFGEKNTKEQENG